MNVFTYVFMNEGIYVCIYVYMYVNMYVRVYLCMCARLCMNEGKKLCIIYVCVCICMYEIIHISVIV